VGCSVQACGLFNVLFKEIVLVPAADASPQVRGALALLPSAGGDQEWEREGVCGREVSE